MCSVWIEHALSARPYPPTHQHLTSVREGQLRGRGQRDVEAVVVLGGGKAGGGAPEGKELHFEHGVCKGDKGEGEYRGTVGAFTWSLATFWSGLVYLMCALAEEHNNL